MVGGNITVRVPKRETVPDADGNIFVIIATIKKSEAGRGQLPTTFPKLQFCV